MPRPRRPSPVPPTPPPSTHQPNLFPSREPAPPNYSPQRGIQYEYTTHLPSRAYYPQRTFKEKLLDTLAEAEQDAAMAGADQVKDKLALCVDSLVEVGARCTGSGAAHRARPPRVGCGCGDCMRVHCVMERMARPGRMTRRVCTGAPCASSQGTSGLTLAETTKVQNAC